ncbi:hypothetical protein V8F06_001438 [Rhypophila decipiens]
MTSEAGDTAGTDLILLILKLLPSCTELITFPYSMNSGFNIRDSHQGSWHLFCSVWLLGVGILSSRPC